MYMFDTYVIENFSLDSSTISKLSSYTTNPIVSFVILFNTVYSTTEVSPIGIYRLCTEDNSTLFSFQNTFSTLDCISNQTAVSAAVYVNLQDGNEYKLLSFNITDIQSFSQSEVYSITINQTFKFLDPCEQTQQTSQTTVSSDEIYIGSSQPSTSSTYKLWVDTKTDTLYALINGSWGQLTTTVQVTTQSSQQPTSSTSSQTSQQVLYVGTTQPSASDYLFYKINHARKPYFFRVWMNCVDKIVEHN